MRKFGLTCLLALTVVAGLPLSGCAPSNESEAEIEGEAATGVGGGPPPKTQEEYMKQHQQSGGGGSSSYSGQGYPGAR